VRRKYRSQASIILDVLEAMNMDVRITEIMTKANLPYDRLKEILNHLLEKKLVEARKLGDSNLYSITLEGMKVRNELRKLRRLFDELGLTL
jgi:predicted transcriptional regulator